MIVYALLFTMQAGPPAAPQQPVETTPTPWPDDERELRNAGAFENANSPEARMMMARYAACVVVGSPEKVDEVLMRDFRTTEYRNGFRSLQRANETCARKVGLRGSLRMATLPFAAALAEEMLERDAAPLKMRLAKAAAGPAVPTYAPSDAITMCAARSVPDDVAALLASQPGSAEEGTALATVETAAAMCGRGAKLEISPTGLRSIVATASYRLLARQAR